MPHRKCSPTDHYRAQTTDWHTLDPIGIQHLPDAPPLELANCRRCNSTLSRIEAKA